jgi:hypothetical protein
VSQDCNENGIPDECEPDCNDSGIPDDCDIASLISEDCNRNGVPDDCDVGSGTSDDCNQNLVPDECDIDPATQYFDPTESTQPLPRQRILAKTGDLDSDGDVDVVKLRGAVLTVLMNSGDGTFEELESHATVDPEGRGDGFALGDLDQDGDIDCVVGGRHQGVTSRGAFQVFINRGDGSLAPMLAVDVALSLTSLVLADLNEDGLLDLIAATNNGVVVLRNSGSTFFDPIKHLLDEQVFWVASADLDGDGRGDLVVAKFVGRGRETSGIVTILLNEGFGFSVGEQFDVGWPETLCMVDLDNDGDIDIGMGDRIALNRGDATFEDVRILPSATGLFPVAAFADVDGDGDVDHITSGFEVGVQVHLNSGEAKFETPAILITSKVANDLGTADLDGDGDLDLLYTHMSNANVGVFFNVSDTPVSTDRNHNEVPDECERGDFDSDGDVDLADLVRFQACFGSSAPLGVPCSPADLDRDGDVDLADYLAWQGLFSGPEAP